MSYLNRTILSVFLFILALSSVHAAETSTTGKALNPDISANFLGLFQRGTGLSDSREDSSHNGFSFQEAELQFTSDVDPYLRASMLFAIKQEEGEFGIDPEEVFVETISLPVVTLKAGKFKLAMGKHNLLHAHAFPFIDAPLIHEALLGDEGLNEAGLSASVLIPTSWYSELTLQIFNPSNEALFNSPNSGDIGGLAHLKNLWDLSDNTTMELGLSGTSAKNEFHRSSSVLGADLTFKWRPAEGGKYHAWIWSTEYLHGKRKGFIDEDTSATLEKLCGFATWMQYQFAQRWWIQGRFEQLGIPHEEALPKQTKMSALLGFFPSEFSGLRLQYDYLKTQGEDKGDHTIAFQYNISIGAHPAHAY